MQETVFLPTRTFKETYNYAAALNREWSNSHLFDLFYLLLLLTRTIGLYMSKPVGIEIYLHRVTTYRNLILNTSFEYCASHLVDLSNFRSDQSEILSKYIDR